MHINSEWDKEYREQSEAFRRYQFDAQQAQTENHTIIARLKEKIASLEEERDRLDDELARYRREGHALRERLAVAESMKSATGGAALEEEVALLRQQVCDTASVCVCMCTCTSLCVCVCVRACVRACVRVCACVCACVYGMCACMCIETEEKYCVRQHEIYRSKVVCVQTCVLTKQC